MAAEIVGYGTFEIADKGDSEASWVATAPTIEEIKQSLDKFQANVKVDKSIRREETVDIESAVGRGIWQFYEQLRSYYEISAAMEIIPRIFTSSFFKRQIRDYASKNLTVSDTHNGIEIFALTNHDLVYVSRQINRWNSVSDGFDKLPASVLLSLVAGFYSAFADFAKILLKSKPDRYSGSDKQYSVAEILKLDSLEQLIEKAAEDEIDQLMAKGHADQISFFEKNFNVSIKKDYGRWSDFIEIFERRNLAAHGSLRVNQRYLDNCKAAGWESKNNIGDILEVDASYLEGAIDILIEFGMLLALSAWQKQYPKSVLESFGAVVEVSYSLLKESRALVAQRLLEYGLKVKSKGADEEKVKMMTINLAIALRQTGNLSGAKSLIENTDWSASPPQFKLCAFAIIGDVKKASSYLEAAKISDSVGIVEVREWPAFQWIRDSEEFKLACKEVFLEEVSPLKITTSATKSIESTSEGSGEMCSTTAPDTSP